MASVQAEVSTSSEVRQLIGFTVGNEQYGLDLLRVREVIRLRQVTWLPKAPACMRGIINLRGQVIPVIDLHERFGLPAAADTSATRVIVVEVGGTPVGMVVDSASEVVRIPADQFAPPPPAMGETARKFVTGVGRRGDDLIITIDVDRILTLDEVSALTGSVAAQA